MKNKVEEKIRICILLEIYGTLLTEKQREFMDLYYNEDIGISEIAQNNEITRQAVKTILTKSTKKLNQYEKQLNFMEKEEKIKKSLKKLKEEKIDQNIIDEIEEQLDF